MNLPIPDRKALVAKYNTAPLFSIVIGFFQLNYDGSFEYRVFMDNLYAMEVDGCVEKMKDFLKVWSESTYNTFKFVTSYYLPVILPILAN